MTTSRASLQELTTCLDIVEGNIGLPSSPILHDFNATNLSTMLGAFNRSTVVRASDVIYQAPVHLSENYKGLPHIVYRVRVCRSTAASLCISEACLTLNQFQRDMQSQTIASRGWYDAILRSAASNDRSNGRITLGYTLQG
jgi:hypothetical protein